MMKLRTIILCFYSARQFYINEPNSNLILYILCHLCNKVTYKEYLNDEGIPCMISKDYGTIPKSLNGYNFGYIMT